MWVLRLIFVLLFSTLCPSSFAIIMVGKRERASCFTKILFLLSCDSKYSVTIPHGAMGWPAVCDCDIS